LLLNQNGGLKPLTVSKIGTFLSSNMPLMELWAINGLEIITGKISNKGGSITVSFILDTYVTFVYFLL
jgi:hypothetical protein